MIWFTCKNCSKTHSRPENSAGTMIFCDCGHGNTVPWESTTAPPAAAPALTAAPKVPDLAPILFDPASVPTTPGHTPPPKPSAYPVKSPPPIEDDRPTRRGRTEKRDPDFCFNHQRRPKTASCADCTEGFCADCVVKYQGASLCGPCKNFRTRRAELPPAASAMASASLIIALIAGPLFMCLLLNSPRSDPMRILSWLSLLPQLLAIGLGVWALRDAEMERKGGGQWVAVTGIATAILTCLVMFLMNLFANRMVA